MKKIEDQPSFISTISTVRKASKIVLKFDRGASLPF